MREITQYRTGSYIRRPVTYVIHRPDMKRSSYPTWVDTDCYITKALRRHILCFADKIDFLMYEGFPKNLIGKVINNEVANHLMSLDKKYPSIIGIVELDSSPGVWIVYNLEESARHLVVDMITTRRDLFLQHYDEYFDKITKSLKNEKCVVKVIKNSSAAVYFADMSPSIYSNYSQEFFDEDDPDLRKILEINERIETLGFVQYKTLRNLAIVLN